MKQPTCRDIHDAASAVHDGELDADRLRAYHQHLEICPPCADFHRSFEATIAAAQRAVTTTPPEDLVEAVLTGVHEALDEAG